MSYHPTEQSSDPSSQQSSDAAQPGTAGERRRVTRIHHLAGWKAEGRRWSMLTAYDFATAAAFDDAGIPVLLVGDSAANVVYGESTTLPVTADELIPLVRGVVRGAPHALVVADLPFGSYESSPEQALATAVRFMKEAGAHAVKIEGGTEVVATIERLVAAGIPVMAHLGFTPQSVNALGGFRVQGRDEAAAQRLSLESAAVEAAGAFALVLEMVPAEVAGTVTSALAIPTVGIGAGAGCDAQVLVWQDMAGLRAGKAPRFVKKYADLRGELSRAAADYVREVKDRSFPAVEHSFES